MTVDESFGIGRIPVLRGSTYLSICGGVAADEGYTAGTGRREIVNEFAVFLTSTNDEAGWFGAGGVAGTGEFNLPAAAVG
jgi:hypothetical protein